MIAEIGHFAMILALCVALVQATVPLFGARRGDPVMMGIAAPAAFIQLALLVVAFAALMHAYVTSDFSLLNVARNSHTDKPLLYKISGVWGNHEGSILLWILILSVFGAAVAAFGRGLPARLQARVLSVQALIGVGFLSFSLFTSNPFTRAVPAPFNGNGLNPLLQDPGLAFHPPMLYLGYVGLSVSFSFAVAALIEGRVDAAWARWVRPWTLAAWCFLTAGIALGSWWAYYELGWGGWWFWDPVENASFMPWLAATALLHSAVVAEKRDTLKSWTVLLAIVAFSLSLLGTFIVRSGVLSSVHAFASDPARGIFILAFLVLVVGGSLTLYAVRAHSLTPTGIFAPISREGALVFNNLMLSACVGTVLFGTLFPLLGDAFGYKVSVGAPYFNIVFFWLAVPLIAAMAVGPLLSWKRADLAGALGRLKAVALLSLAAIVASWVWRGGSPVMAPLGMGLGVWLAGGVLADVAGRMRLGGGLGAALRRARQWPRSQWGMSVAHGGIAVVIFGIAASSAWEEEKILIMDKGASTEIAGYTFTLRDVEDVKGPNYTGLGATFSVTRDGAHVVTLYPEVRRYPTPFMETTEAAIHPLVSGDLYAVIGKAQSRGGWSVRLYHKPLISWLWAGALMMVVGGFLSLSDRRYRLGVPRRAKSAVAAQGAAQGIGQRAAT